MRYPRKKASLQLSINAIVILILAITILGIGLGFIRTQWSRMDDQLTQISQEIEQQIVEKIKSSGEILVFDKTTIEIQRGKDMSFYFGVKNTNAEQRVFGFNVVCVQKQGSGDTECDGGSKGGLEAGDDTWFRMFDTSGIPKGEVKVMRMNLQIPDADADTYEMRLDVYVGDDEDTEPNVDDEQLVTSKTFYIVLS